MIEILRFDGARREDPEIDVWFETRRPELAAIARPWFERMYARGEDVTVLVHDGCPVACVEEAPFAYVNAFKAHVNVGFFYGAFLKDDAGILEGTGKRMRHVKLRPEIPIDPRPLNALIDAAHADIKRRLADEIR